MKKEIYTKQDLYNALKEAGLPCSRPTVIRYEKLGLIAKNKTLKGWKKATVIYTEAEIKKSVERIKEYVHNKK